MRNQILLGALFLTLLWSGCARSPKSDDGLSPEPGAPFSADAAKSDSREKKGLSNPASTPAPESVTIPEGTVIAVRLQNAVSSSMNHVGDTFAAVLDAPLVIDGKTIAERGADVRGRITKAKPSGRIHDPGYIGLTLTSVEIHGKAVPVETSSVFAKGSSHRSATSPS